MAPTIVVRGGRPELVVGGAGGARIIMGVTLAVINTVDFGMDPRRRSTPSGSTIRPVR